MLPPIAIAEEANGRLLPDSLAGCRAEAGMRVACRVALQGKWLQVYWPDDARWWPGKVASVSVKERNIKLLYETSALHSFYVPIHV